MQVLGGGRSVGKSCLIVSLGTDCHLMLDCGMHLGRSLADDAEPDLSNQQDAETMGRFPDFNKIPKKILRNINAIIISHAHLDHIGALPYFTEGFLATHDSQPPIPTILMSHPTRALAPLLLKDSSRLLEIFENGKCVKKSPFSSEMIHSCLERVELINCGQTFVLKNGCKITAHYAGHVLGAIMVHIQYNSQSVYYTGDFNMTPDRHLGAARPVRACPDLLITEATYGGTIRDSQKLRERQLISEVQSCLARHGKILFPVYAIGRAQEIYALIKSCWSLLTHASGKFIDVPVYFSKGLVAQVTLLFQFFKSWMNEQVRLSMVDSSTENLLDFSKIKILDKRTSLPEEGPAIIFATPGMLQAGASLNIFCQLAGDPRNLIILPGSCIEGTPGSDVSKGKKTLCLPGKQEIPIACSVQKISFPCHTDAKGIVYINFLFSWFIYFGLLTYVYGLNSCIY